MSQNYPIIVSFSGVDGAGKTTQIDALLIHLKETSTPCRLFTFWDDVVAFRTFREQLSLKIFKGDKGVGSPEKPIRRRDKNVTSWYAMAARLVLYALDALNLRLFIRRLRDQRGFVIFDRFLYDELANLPLGHRIIRWYVQLLLKLAPAPELALLLDADPESAAMRKPEYPLEFVYRNRASYMAMARLAHMIVIPPGPADETAAAIRNLVDAKGLQLPKRIPHKLGSTLLSGGH